MTRLAVVRKGGFWTLVVAGATALVVLLAVLAIVPEERDLALQAYALFLGGLVLLRLLGRTRALGGARTSLFDEARRTRKHRAERLPELARVEREVALGVANAHELHHRLRARVREIAASRLSARRGIDLDQQPEAARAVLEPALWELVRPDRAQPVDRFAAGLPVGQLRALVDGLDRI